MKRVWLSLPMEYGYFREMIPGFLSYPCRRSGWVPRISEHLPAVLASVLRDPDNPAWTQYSAVVAPFSSPEICRLALESRQKVVNVSAAYDAAELPSVVADNGQVGEIAADHFLGLGFRRMVYVGGNA